MPTPAPQPATEDPWLDAEGTPIPRRRRVEQITVDEAHGALPSRLHQQGQVLGRGPHQLHVHFDHEDQVIPLRPHHLRVIEAPGGC
ncbi:MAG TPA: hypothetical protein VN327_02840 [Pseudonocardiaceae bacterium]|jgi:hypothetical protein|nr:hypothetical protein [Pseudonocardiaceae bacterium]